MRTDCLQQDVCALERVSLMKLHYGTFGNDSDNWHRYTAWREALYARARAWNANDSSGVWLVPIASAADKHLLLLQDAVLHAGAVVA